jgi:senataxin
VAVLNSLHIRQYNKYYEDVRRIAGHSAHTRQIALELAQRAKPRLLVCAPSNAAIDNIIFKIMEDGFIDGSGNRYNPSMIRVGSGKSDAVSAVALERKVDTIIDENMDPTKLEMIIAGQQMELGRISEEIGALRKRLQAIRTAAPHDLGKDWEIRIEESTFGQTGRAFFVNHKLQQTTYDIPPPPDPGETTFPATSMPEHKVFVSRIIKLFESHSSIKTSLDRYTIVKGGFENGARPQDVRMGLETHVLNTVHMVMTTLGTAGSRILEAVDKFEVVVIDEAAQSVEPASLSALQLGSRHAVLVGDPQQLPATIFNLSGRNKKYDRSLFQRLEEAGQPVYLLNEQYRMHPEISHFPRNIFYGGALLDGPNVTTPDYGNPLRQIVCTRFPRFRPFTVLDLDSREERDGTSLANSSEARLAVFLYQQLQQLSGIANLSKQTKVAVISPYAQQKKLLARYFEEFLGPQYQSLVEVNTVDAFQGREANIVIFSAVRAAGSSGVGFLADVRRMNVALTRAKFFLFVIARCQSIVVNPYWNDLVEHARETQAVIRVRCAGHGASISFGDINEWPTEMPSRPPSIVIRPPEQTVVPVNDVNAGKVGDSAKRSDPRKKAKILSNIRVPPTDPRKEKKIRLN